MYQLARTTGCYEMERCRNERTFSFYRSFAPCRSRKKLGLGYTTNVLRPEAKSYSTYKAAFGINRFENIRRHLRFDDKRTREERLQQDKLAAFSYIWGLFIKNCKT